uniref:Uncharacterized protein n=1 Tax=Anguilla anguilla TaxID=7936 RepID=A0A0E9XGB9_ANGAN
MYNVHTTVKILYLYVVNLDCFLYYRKCIKYKTRCAGILPSMSVNWSLFNVTPEFEELLGILSYLRHIFKKSSVESKCSCSKDMI